MMDFYNSLGGRRFIDGTIPKFIAAVERVAKAAERIADALDKQNADELGCHCHPEVDVCVRSEVEKGLRCQ